jgi:FKBP-type peptidyl-prolyl cis-trans isomerase SlyD
MLIAKDSAVTIHFQLVNTQGKVLEKSQQPLAYLHGGYGNIFPKIEAALDGQGAGYEVAVDLSPEDAFGVFDPALQQTIPKTQFPPGVKVGGQVEGRDAEGNARAFWNWQFLGDPPDLPLTRAMLMRACDTRLPARLTRTDLDFIADALIFAAAEVKG